MANRLTEDQKRIVETLDKPLFVAAGAGSGKSSTLAERVAWALSPGSGEDGKPFLNSLDEALIITFTHAAADEIREKIRARLREKGLVRQALEVDSAWISTIHGMCSRILHTHALDLGLDPEFGLVMDTSADEMLEASVESVVADIVREDSYRDLRELFDLRGRNSFDNDTTVIGMVKALLAAGANGTYGLDSVVFPGKQDDVWYEVSAFREACLAAYDTLSQTKAPTSSKTNEEEWRRLLSNLGALDVLFSRRPESYSPIELLNRVKQLQKPSGNAFSAKVAKPSWDVVRAAYGAMMVAVSMAASAYVAPSLLDIAREVESRCRALKAAEGVVDNDDLLRLTHEAFRTHPDLAELYGKKFRLVMVDEFQDTNAQQVQMVEMLSGKDACHLATVGDAQQSIYRFRGADVSVFADREKTVSSDSLVRLAMNFRSHADILSFVDCVCGKGLLPGFMSLAPCPARKDTYASRPLPRVSVELTTGDYQTGKPRRSLAAAQVADRVQRYIEAGTSPDDVAMLLGGMTNLSDYLDALRTRGIDCVVTGGSTFSNAPEVSVVCALLSLLANPRDTDSGLYTVLASDMFLIDADDLCLLSTCMQEGRDVAGKRGIDRGLIDFEFVPGTVPSARLVAAHEVIRRAFKRMGSWPAESVLLGMVRESGWLSRLEARGAEGQAVMANVLAAIRYAAELVDEAGLGFSRAALEFAHWLEIAKRGPASLAGGASGAVSAMTVHASKGLEFPLVVAVECWGKSNLSPQTGLVCENVGGDVLTSLVPAGTGDYLKAEPPEGPEQCVTFTDWACYLANASTNADAAEAARLLYVALTRAREALIVGVPLEVTSKSVKPPLAWSAMSALFGGGLPEVGVSTVDYGGSEPACVRRFHVRNNMKAKDDAERFSVDFGEEEFEASVPVEQSQLIELFDPAVDDGVAQVGEGARPMSPRQGVFSFSSAHARMEELSSPKVTGEETPAERPLSARPARFRSIEDADDLEAPGVTDDEDKATDLGSAFHELAQTMVESGRCPSAERFEEMRRTWHLNRTTAARLSEAIERWSGSDLRAEALSHGCVRAEVPFFQRVSSVFGDHVEGAIDLLCTDPGSRDALVIDYKTGDLGLTESQIRARHEMQANFYAHVLMDEGFERVECAFVCVEVDRGDGQPHVARYSFGSDALPSIDFGGSAL